MEILGSDRRLKVRSSMTLFHRADPAEPVFAEVLGGSTAGVLGPRATDELLARLGEEPARRPEPGPSARAVADAHGTLRRVPTRDATAARGRP